MSRVQLLYFPSEGSHTLDFYALKSTPTGFESSNLWSSVYHTAEVDAWGTNKTSYIYVTPNLNSLKQLPAPSYKYKNQIRGATAPKNQDRLKRCLSDRNAGSFVINNKSLSLNLNFSFLNRISLISSSYPIFLTRLCRPHSRHYTGRQISRV